MGMLEKPSLDMAARQESYWFCITTPCGRPSRFGDDDGNVGEAEFGHGREARVVLVLHHGICIERNTQKTGITTCDKVGVRVKSKHAVILLHQRQQLVHDTP